MATDIAFVVGFLTLLGPRVPHSLKVLLLTLAIADDIGSVLVIAAAYSSHLALAPTIVAAAGLALVPVLRRLGVRGELFYVVLGAVIWLAFLESGIHPTVAGVALGLLTPARWYAARRMPLDVVADLYNRLLGLEGQSVPRVTETISQAERLEQTLHPWVAFVIMPVFALANAGVRIEPGSLVTPVALAVAAGLVVGKPLGVLLFSWIAVRAGLARLPEGIQWKDMVGAGCLAGIGFTMSLFIAGLALKEDLLDEAKIGTLTGSAISALLGCLLLLAFLPRTVHR
jgi:NhaA family Na+:H+ antiporter